MSRSNSLVSLSEGGGGGTPLSRSHSDLSISADANANAANAESSNDLFGSPLDKGQGGSPPCSPGLGMGAADSGASPPFTSGPSPPLTPMPAPGEADQEE
ncbi:hypothetical protein T484DRAFT_1824314 [Baffinella frigidus]|nr:hypothetical protein T484DRAFT_1824314 [Cryptophyta sp. CCMP2293]